MVAMEEAVVEAGVLLQQKIYFSNYRVSEGEKAAAVARKFVGAVGVHRARLAVELFLALAEELEGGIERGAFVAVAPPLDAQSRGVV